MQLLTTNDEMFTGECLRGQDIPLRDEMTTVRDIIVARAEAEVADLPQSPSPYSRVRIQPPAGQQTSNSYCRKELRTMTPTKQACMALESFRKNRYFIFIDDVQAETLDQKVTIQPQTKISFIRLTPRTDCKFTFNIE